MSHQLTEVQYLFLLLRKGERVLLPLSTLALLHIVVTPQKAAYTLHQFLFGIDGMEELGPRQWITRKKAFIEHLSATKGATGNIPGKVKEFDALAGRGCVSGEVLFDLWS